VCDRHKVPKIVRFSKSSNVMQLLWRRHIGRTENCSRVQVSEVWQARARNLNEAVASRNVAFGDND
jgi:hypothetical protein